MEADLSVVCGPPFFPAPKETMAPGFDTEYRLLTNLALAVLICVAATVRIRGGAIRAMCGRTAAPRAARAGSREKAAPRCYAYLLTSDSLLLS